MATLDELQAQLEELNRRVNEITAPPDDYYTHRFSGEEIDNAVDRISNTPGSGGITAEDIGAPSVGQNGQISYSQIPHLVKDTFLYVDGTNGDDSNNGTESQPYKTIMAAINSAPKDLGGHRVYIYVAPGTYDESVVINGFYNTSGFEAFILRGSTIQGQMSEYKISNIVIQGTVGMQISIRGFTIFGINGSSAVQAYSGSVSIENCNIIGDAQKQNYGLFLGAYGQCAVMIKNTTVDGFAYGLILQSNSIASFYGSTIKNCGTGISSGVIGSGTPGIVLIGGVTLTENSVNVSAANGAQILYTHNDLAG